MPKLNDTQSLLLSAAAQRENGSLYPLPASSARGAAITKAIATLMKQSLIEERSTDCAADIHRTDGDLRFGLFATAAGFTAIGVNDAEAGQAATLPAPASPAPSRTKSAIVLDLLERESGATLAELIAATGWLPHTTRAALTGLRKKGHVIERGKRREETCYSIEQAKA
jgi:hypothetical protein